MRRREFIALLGGTAATWPIVARAQTPTKIPRIGVMWPRRNAQQEVFLARFREGLQDLGYFDGKTIKLEERFAENYSQFDAIASELVDSRVDIIVASVTAAAVAATRATKTIPIVFVYVSDPVGSKIVESLARPGGNATGLSSMAFELAPKQMEIFKQITPAFSRVAILVNPSYPLSTRTARRMKKAAEELKLSVDLFEAIAPNELAKTIDEIGDHRPDGLVVTIDIMFVQERRRIAELALAKRIPTLAYLPEAAAAGMLMSYGASGSDLFRRAGVYIDKILRGAQPRDLPVEQPTKFELVINQRTAKALGLTIPDKLLALADEVIE
jgi:putative tryptophan/tyrosine transport system substrate-binding protein